MMKKSFSQGHSEVSIKASSWQSSAACKTSYCHQSSKQALVFGYHLTAQLLIKPLTAVYEKVVDITVTPVNTTKITVAHSPNSLINCDFFIYFLRFPEGQNILCVRILCTIPQLHGILRSEAFLKSNLVLQIKDSSCKKHRRRRVDSHFKLKITT